MICRECGARIDDDALECKFCGAKYAEDEPVQEVVEPVAEEELATDVSEDRIDEIFDENEAKRKAQMAKLSDEKQAQLKEIEKRRKNKKRRQRRNRLLIILLILLCGVAVAAAVYYISPSYTGNNDDSVVIVTQAPSKKPEKTEAPEKTETPMPTIEVVDEEEAPALTDSGSDNTEKAAVTPVVTKKPVATKTPVAAASKPVATKKPTASNTGIASALVVGGSVVNANGTTYMSFTYNGNTCYAKVSDNTTSGFVSGKPMTISATSTGETYNGKNVYTISSITHYNGTYMLQNSGTALLTDADLKGLTAEQLRVARNEIYARHGRTFKDSALQSHFNSCSWYKPNSSYNYANENKNLNTTEKYNVNLIKKYEDALR